MNRLYFTIFCTAFFTINLNAQNVGIGNRFPNAHAILDLSDTAKGILIPRLDSLHRKNIPGTKGLLVYDTSSNAFWYNTGIQWKKIFSGAGNGQNIGDMLYWNGNDWSFIPIGIPGQALVISANGAPTWGAAQLDNSVSSNLYFSIANNSAYKTLLDNVYARFALTGATGPASSFIFNDPDSALTDFIKNLWQLQELPTDEAINAWPDAGVQPLNINAFLPNNPLFYYTFLKLKDNINSCNNLLRQTTTTKLKDLSLAPVLVANIAIYRAEARFLRALSYYYALDLFGSFEFVTENDPAIGFIPLYITRTNLFAYVESELKAIDANLTASKQNEYGRADQASERMLLAKLYLNAEKYTGVAKYTECITALNKIINLANGYSLVSDYNRLFMADNNTNGAQNEIIFPINSDGTRLQTYGNTTFLTYAAVGGSMNPVNYGIIGSGAGLRTRPSWVSIMNSTGGSDQRNNLYTSDQNLDIATVSKFKDGYANGKYRNITSSSTIGSNTTFTDIDFPLFRYADVYLMYAEAFLRGGAGATVTNALNYVNLVRARANTTAITAGQLSLNYILDERARELQWEGQRRTDLIRFDKFTGSTYLWQWKGGVYSGTFIPPMLSLYPIPFAIINANQNMIQNPGY